MEEKLRILIVEDVPTDAELIKHEIKKNNIEFTDVIVDTNKDYIDAINSFKPDIILSDFSLPHFDGMQALKIKQEMVPMIPFILVTGSLNEETAVEVMKAGADDYILKEHIARLGQAIILALDKKEVIEAKNKADKLLKASEERYRSLFENMFEGYAFCKMIFEEDNPVDFIYLKVNNAFEKLTGLKNVEGKKVTEVIPGIRESDDKLFKLYGRVALTGKQEKFEIYVEALKDWYNISVYCPIRGYFVAVFDVITQRKQAEKALQESELKFNTTFKYSPVAILLTSVENSKIIDTNELFLKYTGFKRSEVIGLTTSELGIYENDSDREKLLNEFQKAGYLNGYELDVRMKSGKKLICLVSINNISVDGKPCLLSTIIDISDRKQAEKKLRRSEERFQLAARATKDIIYDWNLTKDEAWFSEAYEKLFGYTESLEKFQAWSKKIHPEDRDKTLAITNSIISGGGNIWTCEYRFRRKDGSYAFVSDRGYVIRDKNGHPVRSIGSIMDITEKKKAEEAIKKSEEKYRILIETMNEALIFVDNDDKIQFVNRSLCEMYGYNQDELLGKIGYEIIVYKDDIEIIKDKNRLRTEGVVDNYEVRGVKKSGEIIWLNISGAPLMDNDGKVVGSIGVISDITKNRQAEEELKKLSRAIEQSPVTIVITDLNGSIEYVNPKFEEITGYSFNEAKGKNPRILKSGELPNEEYKNMWDTITSGGDWRGEFHNKRKDGTLYWESATLSPIKNNEGKITHYLAIKEDITEKKEKERELILAKEKAEESERLKSSFLANMSHELRTPMVGILGYSEVLESQLEEGPHKKMAEAIHNSGNRLMNTLNLVLDLSRIEAGRLELECSEFNIIDTLKDSVELFEQTARKKNLFLKFEKKVNKIIVYLEERLIRDAINNLLNNAIKYSDNGGVIISVDEIKENGIRKLVIDVKDTGIGIPHDEINTVFEEFRQVSEGYDRNFEGSGLGLTIVKRFIEKMNGSISVSSELGKGSTFTIRIPSILAAHTTSNKPLVKDDKMEQNEISNETQYEIKIKNSVLLVDDDETTNSLITSYLKKHYFIDAAVSEEEALTLVKQKKYDLILMDINLGRGRSGIAVTKDIKKMNDYKDVPIIAVTAFAMVGDREEFLAGGCTDYISKPFKLKDLLVMIQKYLPDSKKN
jgi:PAS domain S-box-containing protein